MKGDLNEVALFLCLTDNAMCRLCEERTDMVIIS